MRDKPSFDDLEAPERVERALNGLTDARWAARVARRERVFRAACGVVFGLVVGVAGVWHWMFSLRTRAAALLVVAGSVLLFAALIARKRDVEAMGLAAWILLPEWQFVHRLPWWAIALAWAVAGAALVVAVAAVVTGQVFPVGR